MISCLFVQFSLKCLCHLVDRNTVNHRVERFLDSVSCVVCWYDMII